MSEPTTTTVEVNGSPCRVWTKGSGPKLGVLAGFGGLPRWIPFLDALAKERTVIVPSLPGFPGGERGHTVLDNHLDWVLATHQLLHKSGLDGSDLAAPQSRVGTHRFFSSGDTTSFSTVGGRLFGPELARAETVPWA